MSASSAPGTTASGTGLGLAIAHEAVEHLGGRLTFLNRAGGGLKVAITLPLLKAPDPDRGLKGW